MLIYLLSVSKMLNFPLYQQLKSKLATDYNEKSVCAKINAMNESELEVVQAIILAHFIEKGGSMDPTKFKLPYKGKPIVGGKGCYYVFNNLPKDLQDIIATYVN
jgi:hypothetical protein